MNEEWRTRIQNGSKLLLRWSGWGILIIFIVALIGNSIPAIREYLIRGIDVYARWATNRETQRREEAYRNDTYGGKTPEETLDLFIDALKNNNVELASKYYDLEVQERALVNLTKKFEMSKNLETTVQYFSRVRNGIKKCHELEKRAAGCTFRNKYIYPEETKVSIEGTEDFILIPKGGSLDEIVDLRINHYSQVWKITQPY